MAKHKLTVNIRLVTSAQTGVTTPSPALRADNARPINLSKVYNQIFEDVVVKAADDEREIYASLSGPIQAILYQELAWLCKLMTIGVTGPGAGGPVSLNVRNPGGPGSAFARAAVGGTSYRFTPDWVPRSPAYLKDKLAKKGHTRWMSYDGDLASFLSSPSELLASLGPISVTFERLNKRISGPSTRDQYGRFAKASSGDARVTALPRRDIGQDIGTGLVGGANVGRPTSNISIVTGRIKVSVFGNLTPAMIPALLSGNPAELANGYQSGLTAFLPRAVQNRLNPNAAKNKPYRTVLEPYLGWFLAKSVKYNVLRRVAQLRHGTVGV